MIYLIRHGATDCNERNPPVLQGRGIDQSLNGNGKTQAEKTALFLEDKKIIKIYSSPMKRAYETASAINEKFKLDVVVIEDIIECSIGFWEGMSWPEIKEKYPIDSQWHSSDGGHRAFPQGESYYQVQQRVSPFLNSLNAEENVVVVSHGIVNKSFIAGKLGISLKYARNLPQDNCGINMISGKKTNGSYHGSITVNYIGHLGI